MANWGLKSTAKEIMQIFSVKPKCSMCGRKLDVDSDPLSADCGGDCWGCIGEMEAYLGLELSLQKVREEAKFGLRPNWVDQQLERN